MIFRDREHAGEQLAARLKDYCQRDDVLILALPRGGVPVADIVARELAAPLDVFVVRKVGVPGHEELAMGAVASGGVVSRNPRVIRGMRIPEEIFDDEVRRQKDEARQREEMYRGHRSGFAINGRAVILVDDGLATGASMHAAVQGVRDQMPTRITVAVPVASRDIADALREIVDELVCVNETSHLDGVGRWYEDFSQTTDEEVRSLLDGAAACPTTASKRP